MNYYVIHLKNGKIKIITQILLFSLYKKSIIKTLIHVKINNKNSILRIHMNNININDKKNLKI